MGIPLGHKLKMMKRIKELQNKAAEESKVGVETKNPLNNTKNTELEALPEPTFKVGVETSAQVEAAPLGDSSAMQGQFNEAESHQYFLEALNEWRSGGKENKENDGVNVMGKTERVSFPW